VIPPLRETELAGRCNSGRERRSASRRPRRVWYAPLPKAHVAAESGKRFVPPADGDWVLVIDDAAKGFRAPGGK